MSKYYYCRWCGTRLDRFGSLSDYEQPKGWDVESMESLIRCHQTGHCPNRQQMDDHRDALLEAVTERAAQSGQGVPDKELLKLRRKAMRAGATLESVATATVMGWQRAAVDQRS